MKKTDTQTPKYWQSVEDLNGAPVVHEPSNEFAQPLEIEEMDSPTRRHFMGVMGASMAMASMSGCLRRPVETILPYREMPEDVLPGVPNYYATGTHIGGEAIGLVVESNEGRPTKVEGNTEHPWSNGGTTAIHQATVLDLYDPLRVQAPHQGLKAVKPDVAFKAISQHFKGQQASNGKGLYVLSGANPSPTFDTLMRRFKQKYPLAQWLTYEPLSHDNERNGLKAAFGKPRRAIVNYDRARVVLALDSDFLGTGTGSVVNASKWAARRTLANEKGKMSRLYCVEGVLSVTGSNADHRLRLPTSQIEAFAFQVAIELQKDNLVLPPDLHAAAPERAKGLSAEAKEFAKHVAADLVDSTKPVDTATHGAIVVGRRQGPLVHNLAAAINQFLVKTSGVVAYYPDPGRPENDLGDGANIARLKADLDAGKVETLVVIGSNPVYTAPGNLGLDKSIRKAKTLMTLADHHDETAKGGTWTFPRAHYLEAWGDLVSPTGTLTVQQPLIAPLHEGSMSDIEFVARMLGDEPTDGHTLVREQWRRVHKEAGSFEKAWRQRLHTGKAIRPVLYPLAGFETHRGAVGLLNQKPVAQKASKDSLEVVFLQSHTLFDGRYSNNSWLQECPDPITKVCWDNPVLISPKTAKDLGIDPSSFIGKTMTARVSLKVNGVAVDMAAWIVPGMADNTAAVTVGYGRDFQTFMPYHDKGVVGFNVNPMRTNESPDFAMGGVLAKTGGEYPIACLQRYGKQTRDGYEDAPNMLVREATLAQYMADPTFAKAGLIQHSPEGAVVPKKKVNGKDVDYIVFHPPTKALHDAPAKGADYTKGYQWGMAIDLNKCTGCNACIVACQAENNIPSVGKNEARYGREMHWLRIDRYFNGSETNPQVVFQPMLCQQCEMAPCENVCPVQATAHSPEGLNDMVYNRCIGTRYCANNCPVKVRRFNFYNYTNSSSNWKDLNIRISNDKEKRTKLFDPKGDNQLAFMVRNPDVSVRFRGVMEKCTWCVQRVNRARIKAKLEPGNDQGRSEIRKLQPACMQACPTSTDPSLLKVTGCIEFGDILDKDAKVAQQRGHNRNYQILSELNIRPRLTYLAKVRNPNPKLEKKKG